MAAFICISAATMGQSAKQTATREIAAAEKAFNDMAAAKGIKEAFVYFAAEDVIIKRGKDSLIYGRAGVGNFYAGDFFKNASVTWAPDVTDASESGDMGYTIGKYKWVMKDKSGAVKDESHGIFHTVWKKQKDGSWKYVWD